MSGLDDVSAQQAPYDIYGRDPTLICEHCNYVSDELNMVSHIHFGHRLQESAFCPCNGCKAATLVKSNDDAREWEDFLPTANLSFVTTPGEAVRGTVAEQTVLRTTPGSETETLPGTQQRGNTTAFAFIDTQGQRSNQPADLDFRHQATTSPSLALSTCLLDNSLSSFNSAEPGPTQHFSSNTYQHPTNPITPTSSTSGVSAPQAPMMMQYLKTVATTPIPISTPDPFERPTVFVQADGQIRENNLPYEMSLIEMGNFRRDVKGQVNWCFVANPAPALRNEKGELVRSGNTKKDMRALAMLPAKIERSFPPWLLVLWSRQGAAQHLDVRFQDIFDRMDARLTHSALSNRMQKWLAGTGALPLYVCINFDWPSKQTIECVQELTFLQARFNTWWDVEYLDAEGVYMVRQPTTHPGYRDVNSQDVATPAPWYIIDDADQREASERLKLISDAILFLEIKAEEGGMQLGTEAMLSWIAKTPLDHFTEILDRDILLEFKRWRDGCPDTPSIADLRDALSNASSLVEINAIIAGDYSFTPALQVVVASLGKAKEARRRMDAGIRAEASRKSALRAQRRNEKRKADALEEGPLEM